MPAVSSSLISPALEQLQDLPAGDRALLAGQCPGLLGCLALVPDPRDPRGVRHTLSSLLLTAAAAVLAGARSFTAIGEWAADAPPQVLASLGVRYDPLACRFRPPDEATIRRVLEAVDADALDAAVGSWLGARLARAPARPGHPRHRLRHARAGENGPPGEPALNHRSWRQTGQLTHNKEIIMPTASYAGQMVSVSDDGFFTDPSQWTEDMAPQIAKAEGIDQLTDRHWQVIKFMRHEYQEKGTGPTVRILGKTSGVSIKELYQLFPKGPAKIAAKVACIPKPRGCI